MGASKLYMELKETDKETDKNSSVNYKAHKVSPLLCTRLTPADAFPPDSEAVELLTKKKNVDKVPLRLRQSAPPL